MSLICLLFSAQAAHTEALDKGRYKERKRDRKDQKEKALLLICREKNTKNSKQQWAGVGGQFRW